MQLLEYFSMFYTGRERKKGLMFVINNQNMICKRNLRFCGSAAKVSHDAHEVHEVRKKIHAHII